VTSSERENVPRPDVSEDEAPDQDDSVAEIPELDEEDLVEDDEPSAGQKPVPESIALSTQRPRRAYDSIMDYVPSTTMGQVIRPTPTWRTPVIAIAALVLLGVGVLVTFRLSSDTPAAGDAFVQAPWKVAEAASSESPAVDDEVEDDEILLIEDDEILIIEDDDDDEVGAKNERGSRPGRAQRQRKPRGRGRGERPPPDATIVELDRLTVRRTLRSRMVHLHRCYDEALKSNPDLAGRMEIEITIGIQGNVTDAVIKRDSLRHDRTKNCILARLRGWKFHIGGWLRRPVAVSFPVVFSG
jgi:hypothetical protein